MKVSNRISAVHGNSSDISVGDLKASMFLSASETLSLTILVSVSMLIGVVANSLVILAFLDGRSYSENPTNLLLLSQTIADLRVNLITSSLYIYNLYDWVFGYFLSLGKLFGFASVESIVSLTVNRLISVYWSLEYPRIVTSQRVQCVVILQWSLSCVLCALNVVGESTPSAAQLQRNMRYLNLLAVIIFLGCYIAIYKVSVSHRKEIENQLHGITGKQAGREADFKSVSSLLFVTISFIVGWLPVTLVATILDRDRSPTIFYRYIIISSIFVLYSSAINPFIYYLRSENFRLFVQRFHRIYIAPRLVFATRKHRYTSSRMTENLDERTRPMIGTNEINRGFATDISQFQETSF